MPNWCSNRVCFTGDDKEISTFKDSLVETVHSQKIAGSRAMIMVIQEQFEPGSISEMSWAILKDKICSNTEFNQQLFNTINHIWRELDKDNLSDSWESVWDRIKLDWGYRVANSNNTFQKFIEDISKDIEYENKPEGYLPFDFAQFCPLRLTSVLLGFNSLTEEWIEPLLKTLPYNNYYSQNALWGTKWNAVEVCNSREQPENGFALSFSTAWSPPIPVFESLSEMYPEITVDLTFSECGADYQGRMVIKGGDIVFERTDSIQWIEDDNGDVVETADVEWMELPLDKLMRGVK